MSSEVSRQIAATKSESARHALAYGRFEETMLQSFSLIPNIQNVVSRAYDELGNPRPCLSFDIYSNTVNNLLASYLGARDRDLRPLTAADLNSFKAEVKSTSAETASRNFVKQCYERSFSEAMLFARIFAVEPQYSNDTSSVFMALKSHRGELVNGVNIQPIAQNVQSVQAAASLRSICNMLEWVTNEYLLREYDDEETPFTRHCRELTARLLTEYLWTFADAVFEADIATSITRAPVAVDALKIGPVVNGVASSNAYPPVRRALELLLMFDQSMPKERCVSFRPLPHPRSESVISSHAPRIIYSRATVRWSSRSSRRPSTRSSAPRHASGRPRTARTRTCS